LEGGNALVVGRAPAGDVLYSTRRFSPLPNPQLADVDRSTGIRTAVELGKRLADRAARRRPDIVVDNMPHATFAGGDAQLDPAIKYVQEQIRLHPVPVPAAAKYLGQSFKPRRNRGSQPEGGDQQP
jgi:hypothetical protein